MIARAELIDFIYLFIYLYIYLLYFAANGPAVIARWTNNKYYSANILYKSNHQTTVIFTDGDKLTYSNGDVSAVFPDKAPNDVQVAYHVVAKWNWSKKYHIGFVTAKSSNGYVVTFDDGDKNTFFSSQLRILPNQDSPHKGKLGR